jgi:hypothetical protein
MIVLLQRVDFRAFRLLVLANSYRTVLFPCQAPSDGAAHLRRIGCRTGIKATATSQRKGAKNAKGTQELNENPENPAGQGLGISSRSAFSIFQAPLFFFCGLCVEIQRRRQALSLTSTEPTPSMV